MADKYDLPGDGYAGYVESVCATCGYVLSQGEMFISRDIDPQQAREMREHLRAFAPGGTHGGSDVCPVCGGTEIETKRL